MTVGGAQQSAPGGTSVAISIMSGPSGGIPTVAIPPPVSSNSSSPNGSTPTTTTPVSNSFTSTADNGGMDSDPAGVDTGTENGGRDNKEQLQRTLANYFAFIAAGTLLGAGTEVLGGISGGLAGLAKAGLLGTTAGAVGDVLLVGGALFVGGTMVVLGTENLIHQATGATPISDATGIPVPIFSGGP